MLSKAYKRVLLSVSMIISLFLLASPASAMCFYNKINPSDFAPEGYTLSQEEKTIGFRFTHDGFHMTHEKFVPISEHQCIGGDGASVILHLMAGYTSESHVDPHGYVVVETEPSDLSDSNAKYFKLKMSVYSRSNALQNSVTSNMGCAVGNMPYLHCWTI